MNPTKSNTLSVLLHRYPWRDIFKACEIVAAWDVKLEYSYSIVIVTIVQEPRSDEIRDTVTDISHLGHQLHLTFTLQSDPQCFPTNINHIQYAQHQTTT